VFVKSEVVTGIPTSNLIVDFISVLQCSRGQNLLQYQYPNVVVYNQQTPPPPLANIHVEESHKLGVMNNLKLGGNSWVRIVCIWGLGMRLHNNSHF